MRQLNEDLKSRLLSIFRKPKEEAAKKAPEPENSNWKQAETNEPSYDIDKATASTMNQHHASVIQAAKALRKLNDEHKAKVAALIDQHPAGAIGELRKGLDTLARAHVTVERHINRTEKNARDRAHETGVDAHNWGRTPVPEKSGYTRPPAKPGAPKSVPKPMGVTKV